MLGVGFRRCCGFLVSLGGQDSGAIPVLQVHRSHLSGHCEAEGGERFYSQLGSAFWLVGLKTHHCENCFHWPLLHVGVILKL